MQAYELQAALNEVPGQEQESTSFFVREAPRYYALGQGRYWLKELGSLDNNADSATTSRGEVMLALPRREGTFRLLMTFTGDSLLLQQRQAMGAWQSQLHFSLQATADSLPQRYGRHHATTVDLPAPVVLRASSGRLQLRLFIPSLNRGQFGKEARYAYSLEGELQIRP